jgi:hypothetical protein
MAKDTGFHYYLNWAKERIDEMDAILTSLEAKVPSLQADLRARADEVLADLGKKRDLFRDAVKQQAEASESSWISLMTKLESEWKAFEAEVRKYVDTFAKQAEQQRAAFKSQADAQMKAWREAAGQFGNAAKGFAAEHQSDLDALISRMNSEAAAAEPARCASLVFFCYDREPTVESGCSGPAGADPAAIPAPPAAVHRGVRGESDGAEVERGGNSVVVRLDERPDGNARRLRSCQSGGQRRIQEGLRAH